jgi:hypothetical protein
MSSSGTFIDSTIFYFSLTGAISERNETYCMRTETHEIHYKEEVIEMGAEGIFKKKCRNGIRSYAFWLLGKLCI